MPNLSKVKKNKKKPKSKVTKTTKVAQPKLTKPPKNLPVKHSPVDYYNCLLNYSQQDFYDPVENKKLRIHACCKKCKQRAPSLNNLRSQELKKLITAYQQVGDSLKKLLKPIN
jgi:hypothetical protein